MEMALAVRKEVQTEEKQEQQHADHLKTKEKKTFSLETYLDFLQTRDLHNLTVDYLNRIISLHGYKKVSNRKKAEEAVGSIAEPIHPGRSTLKDGVPPPASAKGAVTLTEAVKDLKLLNWQECSVSSIRVLSSKTYSNPDDIPVAEVAEKLMSLKSNKRRKLSTSVAKSVKTKSGPGSGGSSSSKMPDIGIKKKSRSKRVYLKKIYYTDDAITALAATQPTPS